MRDQLFEKLRAVMGTSELALSGQALIESIRRHDYMIGLEMSQEVAGAANKLREQLNRALALLSTDLYSSDTHFLLELVQNADDNSYAPDVVPSVRITLSLQRLIFLNNELGFAEKNVRALCAVGQSTKAADKKSGFIGEKGIGFKSVFQVSDKPEIHSNGFHFAFDMSRPEELLGYVVPHWKLPDVETGATGTTIVLPAKSGRIFTDAVLKELHPKLMLFLRRLRHLDMVHEAGHLVFERQDFGNVISIVTEECGPSGESVNRACERYMRFAHRVSMVEATDEKREGAIETDLVLAFPLDAQDNALAEPGKEVFAFLPIRSFGFRFYVQGDFLLSSSREDIHGERMWNQTLRDSIAPAFVRAIEPFRAAPATANGYLNYLPRKGEITHEFFTPVVEQLYSALSDTECIPCATGAWRKPSQVMLTLPRFAELISPEDALMLFGKDYPLASLTVDSQTLSRLGCKALSYEDIVEIFRKHAAWLHQRGTEWLLDFYRFIAGLQREPLLKAGFAKADVVLDSTGILRCPTTTRIFYPLVPGKKFGFEHELTFCNGAISQAVANSDKDLRSLFDDVGVKSADPYQLITDHILPLHEKDDWKGSGDASLVGHLRYVKEKLNEYLLSAKTKGTTIEAAWESLRKGLWVGTKHSANGAWTFWRADQMYFSSEYIPDFDIESLLGDKIQKTALLSPLYVIDADSVERPTLEDLSDWRAFFTSLGINASPRVERKQSGDVECSKELQQLLDAQEVATRRLTLECLDRHWSAYPVGQRFVPKGRPQSAFQQYSFVGKLHATIAPSRKRTVVTLSTAFLDSPELREAFGDSPHYVDAKLSNDAFLDACGIHHRPDVPTCVARLLQLHDVTNAAIAAVRPIYRMLERLYERDAETVKQAFRIHALILVRGTTPSWKRLNEVVWSQQGEFLNTLYPSLQGRYGEFHSFFLRKLGVAGELSTSALIRALPSLASSPMPPEGRSTEAMRIYTRANREVVSPNGDGSAPAWLNEFRTAKSFLSTGGHMVTNDGHLFVNDDPTVAALFRDRPGIHFVDVPVTRLPQIRALLDAARVPTLSSNVSLRLVDPGPGRGSELTSRIAERYLLIARVVYASSHGAFTRAVESGRWRILANLTVSEVDNLVLHAELMGEVATTTGHVLIDGTKAFVRTGVKGVVDRLAAEICAFLSVSPALADTVSRILSEHEFAGAEEFLEVKGVTELPTEEEDALLSDGNSVDDGDLGQAVTQFDDLDEEQSGESAAENDAAGSDLGESTFAPGVAHPASPAKGAGPFDSARSQGGRPISGRTGTGSGPGTAVSPPPSPTGPQGSGAAGASNVNKGASQSNKGSMRFSPIVSGVPLPPRLRSLGLGSARGPRQEGGRRLLSYVEPVGSGRQSDDSDSEAADARTAVEQAAVQFLLTSQAANWESLEEMPHFNKGFDIRGTSLDGREYYIEVKGQSGAWTASGIAMTPSEVLCAAEHRDRYWLCVVEHALDENRRRMYIVKNPFGSASQFRYDSGWKDISISEKSSALTPVEGLRIEIEGLGAGLIVAIPKSGGIFSSVRVRLDDGTEITRIFNPAKMRLSKAG